MIRLAQQPSDFGTVTVTMTGYTHGQPPVVRTLVGQRDKVREALREEYRQHLLSMAESYAQCCTNPSVVAQDAKQQLVECYSNNLNASHIQIAQSLMQLFTTRNVIHTMQLGVAITFTMQVDDYEDLLFLEKMLPLGVGYTHAHALMTDLFNTAKAYLTDASSLWVHGWTREEQLELDLQAA
jgi:hypothetical protein